MRPGNPPARLCGTKLAAVEQLVEEVFCRKGHTGDQVIRSGDGDESCEHVSIEKAWLYAGRVARSHCNHRNPRSSIASRDSGGSRSGAPSPVYEQSEAARNRRPQLSL